MGKFVDTLKIKEYMENFFEDIPAEQIADVVDLLLYDSALNPDGLTKDWLETLQKRDDSDSPAIAEAIEMIRNYIVNYNEGV